MSIMLRSLSPVDTVYDGTGVLTIGTPSCGGWSNGATFYVDVPCLDGDTQGTLLLIAHEVYHGVQDQFMGPADDQAPSVMRLFDTIIREGTALYLADFSRIEEPGRYSKLNQDVIKTNANRMAENFNLLEILAAHLQANDTPESYAKAYSIGASGLFDSPFYAIGDHMTETLVEHYGDKATVCVIQLPANHFFAAYDKAIQKIGNDHDAIPPADAIMEAVQTNDIDRRALKVCL